MSCSERWDGETEGRTDGAVRQARVRYDEDVPQVTTLFLRREHAESIARDGSAGGRDKWEGEGAAPDPGLIDDLLLHEGDEAQPVHLLERSRCARSKGVDLERRALRSQDLERVLRVGLATGGRGARDRTRSEECGCTK